jgi:hypothetical protein
MPPVLKAQKSLKLARARSHKLAKLKGFHKCCGECKTFADGSEEHYELVDSSSVICFKAPKPPGYAKEDPELWELTRKENLELARQKAYNEFAAKRVAAEKARYEKLKHAFEVFDVDGSGTLDSKEMKGILTRASGGKNAMTEKEAEEFIAEFDHNGDGHLQYTEVRFTAHRSSSCAPWNVRTIPSPVICGHFPSLDAVC